MSPEKDIQTTNITVYPTFDNRGRITGYTVSTRMTAKTHDVPGAGKVIDAAAKLGGDDLRVDSIQLSIEDTGPVVHAARPARSRHGPRTGRATRVRRPRGARRGPHDRGTARPTLVADAARLAADKQNAAAIPVSAGTQDLQIQVKVVYEIR